MINEEKNIVFSFLTWNVRSIRSISAFVKLKVLLNGLMSAENSNAITCFIFTETWITHNPRFNFNSIKNYNNVHIGRPAGVKGGGISVYIKKPIILNEIFSVVNNDVEALLVECLQKGFYRKILAVYRPPSGNLSSFMLWLEEVLEQHNDLIIAGDFNINILSLNSHACYTDVLKFYSYRILNNIVTREISSSLIDHVIVNEGIETTGIQSIIVHTARATVKSDHSLIVTLLKGRNHPLQLVRKIIKKVNYNAVTDILNVMFRDVNTLNISNCNLKTICENIGRCIRDNTITLSIKHRANEVLPPWVDAKYKRLFTNINNLSGKITKLKAKNLMCDRMMLKYNDRSREEMHITLIYLLLGRSCRGTY